MFRDPGRFIILVTVILAVTYIVQKWQARRSARKILKQQKDLYGEKHELRSVTPDEFPWLDRSFYDTTRDRLAALGFRHLGDQEDVTVTKTFPSMRTFARVMVSQDGCIVAGCYHFMVRSLWMKLMLKLVRVPTEGGIFDLESQFTGGSFAVTGNTLEMDKTGDVPGIARRKLPLATPVEEVLRVHVETLRDVISRYPDLRLVQVQTLQEADEFGHRLQQIKNAHKQKIGYMNKEEMMRIGSGTPGSAKMLAEEIEKIKAGD